jgi:PAS domain S-box-containing protein
VLRIARGIEMKKNKGKDEQLPGETEELRLRVTDLEAREERFRTTLRSIGDAVIATDAAGLVTDVNPVAEALTGWNEAEVVGKPLAEVFRIVNEETRAEVENPVRRVLREGAVVGLANHTLLIARDGTEHPVADSGAPIRDEKGGVTGVVLVFRDQAEERAAQRALRESERKFRDIVRFLDGAYYSCTVDGVLREHNEAFNSILGFGGGEDLKGSRLPDFWQDPDDRKAYVEELMSRGIIRNYLINARTIRGDRIVVMANAHLLKDETGAPSGIEGTFTDFTERRRMEEELIEHRDELEALVNQRTHQLAESEQRLAKETAAVAAIVGEMLSGDLTDAETERQTLNACLDATGSAYGMIGVINRHGRCDVTTYNGRTLGDCAFPEALAGEMSKGMEIRGIWGWPMIHGRPLLCNDLKEHPDRVGQPAGHVPIECFLGVPVRREGKVAGMMAVANKPGGYTEADEQTLARLVEVMAVSRQHRELLTEMEKLVRDRTAQLEESNEELEAFSYSVSHDLRAPLRAIDGFTRILVDDYEPRLNSEGKRLCSIIRENTGKMGRLIDDLLAFSRLGRTEMQPSRIDMGTMASSVFHELTTPESRARIDFRVGAVPDAVGDPSLIRQVWMNLLGNAVKFSSRRERAVIRVSGESTDAENVYTVEDNGAGFEMQYVHKLFGVFQRLHSTKEFEGTGVGLALVHRVIRRHGGRVWGEGETGRGATFHFTLPRKGA